MKVLICGDRNWKDRMKIRFRLQQLLDEVEEFFTIIEGGARGADTIAREEAERLGIRFEEVPADWSQYGRAAGPIRNAAMLSMQPSLVIAFHSDLLHSKGTMDMVRRARQANIEVEVIT